MIFLLQVLLALYEKEVLFKPKLVSLFSGQHNAPWYVQLNPEGVHVPVLQDGDTTITDPDKIIKHIDTAYPSGQKFIGIILYNNGPLLRETSRFVNLKRLRVDKSCFPSQ